MPETVLKIVKVFIGSPGGLEDERQAAKRIVDEINQSHSEHWGCQFNLVGWEATLPGYSRAQSLINQDLDKCEYFVGLIWNHWGSKPDDGDSRYSSGFEEEFDRAKTRFEKGLMKDIALFFKDIPEVQIRDSGPSVKKVIDFRQDCIKRRKPLFKNFNNTDKFGTLFRATIEGIGWHEAQILGTSQDEASGLGQPARTEEKRPSSTDDAVGLIGAHSAKFINELLQKPSERTAVSAFEVARLRLIASSVSRTGNDELYLGNHDANLLFMKRNDLSFSVQEKCALVDTGVAGFDEQNVPFWFWAATPLGSLNGVERVKFLATAGNSQGKPNAIRILQSMGHGTPTIDRFFDREKIIRRWLLNDSTTKEIKSALEFLRTNGDREDLTIVEGLMDEVAATHKNRVTVTVIAMLAAMSTIDAFKKLLDLDPDPLGESVTDQLFSHPESIPTATLECCLSLKSDFVRRNAATLLHSRQALDTKTAERLMTDSDPEVRLVAVECLVQKGRTIEEETIKKALTRPESNNLFSLSIGSGYRENVDCYVRYQENRLSQLSYKELRQKADAGGVFAYLEVSTLNQRFTGRRLAEIRGSLKDGFKSHFDDRFEQLASLPGISEKLVTDTRDMEQFLRRRLTTKTLDTLCAYGDSADLQIVRNTLDQYATDYSESVLRFLARFGDWSDRDRILLFDNRYPSTGALFSGNLWTPAQFIAAALYAAGKSRLADLLELDVGITIRRALVARMSQKDILSMSDNIIIVELNNEDDNLRKILALKCTQAMSQTRIRKLLDRYIDQDGQRYYNSIHWLDLGASMPRQVAKTVAKFELAKLQ